MAKTDPPPVRGETDDNADCAMMPTRPKPSAASRTTADSGASRLPRRAAMLMAVAALLAGPAAAQDPPRPVVRIEGDYLVISVDEQDGIEIEEFIKLAEQMTKKVFTFSRNDIGNAADNKITFIGTKRIRKDNFFAFFQTMLYIKGFATLIRGDDDTEVVEIVAIQGPKRTDLSSSAHYVPAEEIASYANQSGVPILSSVELQYINTNQAVNQLRPFFTQSTGGANPLTLGAAAGSLLLQGFGPQVYAAHQVLKLVDVPPETPDLEVRVVKLEHASAEELEPILKEVLESQARAQQQAQQQAGGAPAPSAASSQIKIVPHNSLNAVLLAGTHEQIVEGRELIAQLDVPTEATDGDTKVIRLKNVLADDLFRTLNRFITDDLAAERQAQQGQGRAQTRQPRKTVVVPHKESNSLLISSSATKFRQLQRVIDDLDRRQPQVLIECAVIELTSSDMDLFGIELTGFDGIQAGSAASVSRPFGVTSFGITEITGTGGPGDPITRVPNTGLRGVTGGIFSIEAGELSIPIILNALASDSNADVLSLPSVLVNNNENASVSNQESRPTQTISQGNATTSTGAGANQSAGITLQISPSISSNNYLRLNINLNVSRFLTPFDPNSVTAGVTATRSISTQVTMPSGHTMVLGGVIEDTQSSASDGIPILKDIPLLGWLFRSWSQSSAKTNLYFFLTPHILDEEDFSDLAEQSFRKKLEAAEYIGHNRVQLIDRRWRGARPQTLEDPGATIEDIDDRGGFDIPFYQRPQRTTETRSSGPALPTDPQGTTTPQKQG